MALRVGKCTNFGNCSIADSRQNVQVADGSDMVCPECRRILTDTTPARKNDFSSNLLPILVAVLLLFGGIGFVAYRLMRPKPDDSRATTASNAGRRDIPVEAALRLCGSNTIGSQLAPALVKAFLTENGGSDVRVSATASDEVSVTTGGDSPQSVSIQAHGSATAFHGLSAGNCDIGMASRKVKDEEVQNLSRLGDLTSPASEHVLGLDGIAVIVNRSNPISSLTVQQIASLFSGNVSSWAALGGSSGTVKIYARDDKSGTYDTFKSLVLGTASLTAHAQRLEDSRSLSEAVANDPDAIGFVGLPYVGGTKALAVSEPGARALVPNTFTIATEDYLLSRRLYLYTAAAPKPVVRKFVDFALSKAGQDIVAQTGFVEQNVRVQQSTETLPGASAQYQQTVRGAQRLSLDFRFRTGSSQLDNKALADIDRVTSLLSDLHYTGQNVLLPGFADSTGTAAKNLTLSKERAQAVAAQFSQRGVQPGVVTGFGAGMPVASNETEEGRQKNRRVEIWVRKLGG